MKHLWNYCCLRRVTLCRDISYFPHNRENGRDLMESFINSGYHGHNLAAINRCRLFLKVILLSDITTGYGNVSVNSHIVVDTNNVNL